MCLPQFLTAEAWTLIRKLLRVKGFLAVPRGQVALHRGSLFSVALLGYRAVLYSIFLGFVRQREKVRQKKNP